MCVGSRSPQKVINLQLFLIIRRKCVKMGAQMEGENSNKSGFERPDGLCRRSDSFALSLFYFIFLQIYIEYIYIYPAA